MAEKEVLLIITAKQIAENHDQYEADSETGTYTFYTDWTYSFYDEDHSLISSEWKLQDNHFWCRHIDSSDQFGNWMRCESKEETNLYYQLELELSIRNILA